MQRALIYALGTALVTLTFCLSVTAYAYQIYPADKAVLMDWLSYVEHFMPTGALSRCV
jgi:hypothetical protein